MNERVPVEFSVSGVSFRRGEETYTARVEVTWGIQALPYVYEYVMVGMLSPEYLAAAAELPEDQLNEQYPITVYAPGYAFTGTASCAITPVIYTTGQIYSGFVTIRPSVAIHETVEGQWSEIDAGVWQAHIPGVVNEDGTSFNGTTYSHAYPLFIGDPTDSCATSDTGGGSTGGGSTVTTPSGDGGSMGTVSPAPSYRDGRIPGCVTLTEWTCPATPTTVEACSLRCRNPLYASEHTSECSSAPSVSSLRVEPAQIRVGAGRRGLYRVVAVFSNGQQADITSEAVAVTSDIAKAAILTKGAVKGIADGSSTLTVSWKGKTAVASLQTFTSQCDGTPWDVVLVLDQALASYWFAGRSSAPGCGLYWRREEQQSDFVAEYANVALALALGMSLKNPWDSDAGTDRLSIIATGEGAPRVTTTWTDTVPVVSGLCYAMTDSRLGEALRMARTMLNSARVGARRLVVLVTSGSESVCSPNARTAAEELRSAGAAVAVVTPLGSAPWTVFSPCTYPETADSYLAGVANPGMYLEDPAGTDAMAILAEVQSTYCASVA